MTTINVSEPAGGRARFRHRTPSEALEHYTLAEIPGSIEVPVLDEGHYYQVTLRRASSDGGQWAETFAIQPPDDGTYDLEDEDALPRMSLGEAAGGGFALTGRVVALEASLEDSSDAVQTLQSLLSDVDALEVETSAGTLISLNGVPVFYDSGWRDVSSHFGDDVDLDHSYMHVKRTIGELRFRGHISFTPGTGATFILKLPSTSGWMPEISGDVNSIGPVMTFAGGLAITHFVRLNTFRDFAYMGTFSGGDWSQDRPTGEDGISFDVSLTASDTLPTSLIDTPA